MDYCKCCCENCLFYRADGDDIGTCTISDNIVEPMQEVCNDFMPSDDPEDD